MEEQTKHNEWKGDMPYKKPEEEMIDMFKRAYRESTLSIIESCHDPVLKQKLQNILNKSWPKI
jgi:hypothetical protein